MLATFLSSVQRVSGVMQWGFLPKVLACSGIGQRVHVGGLGIFCIGFGFQWFWPVGFGLKGSLHAVVLTK